MCKLFGKLVLKRFETIIDERLLVLPQNDHVNLALTATCIELLTTKKALENKDDPYVVFLDR